MSQGSTGGYKLEHVPAATEQIHAIAAIAKQTGKLKAFQDILFEAVRRLKDDPHGWGDPAYHKAVGGGIVCHALIRPIAIHYVIYESLHAVVLLDVHQFAAFD
jgi:hypothetical protein